MSNHQASEQMIGYLYQVRFALALLLDDDNPNSQISIEKRDIRIRPKCQEAFVMRGSYHILANQLRVGWHKDFYERLRQLINT